MGIRIVTAWLNSAGQSCCPAVSERDNQTPLWKRVIKTTVISVRNKKARDSLQEDEWAGGGALWRRSGDSAADSSLDAATARPLVSQDGGAPALSYTALGRAPELPGCTEEYRQLHRGVRGTSAGQASPSATPEL